jgi:hypothetical protein
LRRGVDVLRQFAGSLRQADPQIYLQPTKNICLWKQLSTRRLVRKGELAKASVIEESIGNHRWLVAREPIAATCICKSLVPKLSRKKGEI